MPTALVTGASSGIGRELARRFAADRHDLVLVARSAERLGRLADELAGSHGVTALALPTDLTEPAGPAGLGMELGRRGIEVDVLVNSAGVGSHGPFIQSDLSADLRQLRLNIEALLVLTKLLLPGMVARGRGRVANLASTAAFQPGPLMAVYYATKAFVLSFSEALAHEVAGTGVAVTAVCPGPTPTGFQEAAGVRGIRLLQTPLVMPVERVADIAYRGIRRGKRVVVPGWGNKALALSVRLSPRRFVTAVVGFVNGRVRA